MKSQGGRFKSRVILKRVPSLAFSRRMRSAIMWLGSQILLVRSDTTKICSGDDSADGNRGVVTGFVRQVERCVGMYDSGEVMSEVSTDPG